MARFFCAPLLLAYASPLLASPSLASPMLMLMLMSQPQPIPLISPGLASLLIRPTSYRSASIGIGAGRMKAGGGDPICCHIGKTPNPHINLTRQEGLDFIPIMCHTMSMNYLLRYEYRGNDSSRCHAIQILFESNGTWYYHPASDPTKIFSIPGSTTLDTAVATLTKDAYPDTIHCTKESR